MRYLVVISRGTRESRDYLTSRVENFPRERENVKSKIAPEEEEEIVLSVS